MPHRLTAFAICCCLAIAHTWPLALPPGRHSLNANADAELNAWIMAWVAHRLPRDPLHLFEANIFYPAHDALAFSEPLILPALVGAPLAWMGASPVLVHNLILLLGLTLTAFAAIAIAVALAARLKEWGPRVRRVGPALALAAITGAMAIAPVYLPYRR